MIKAFFLDFYGTVVHEDGEVVKKISQLIYETGKAESPSEVDSFGGRIFRIYLIIRMGIHLKHKER